MESMTDKLESIVVESRKRNRRTAEFFAIAVSLASLLATVFLGYSTGRVNQLHREANAYANQEENIQTKIDKLEKQGFAYQKQISEQRIQRLKAASQLMET